MPVLLLLLAAGVFAYLLWRSRSTTLTRECRWRQDRAHGVWRCSFCGAESAVAEAPEQCLKDRTHM